MWRLLLLGSVLGFPLACTGRPPLAAAASSTATVQSPGVTTETPLRSGVHADGGQEGAETAVRFVAIGDTGFGSEEQRQVARAIAQQCRTQGCDFVLLLGDNFYPSGPSSPDDPGFKSRFEEPFAPVEVPFYVVLGNHDYGSNGRGDQFERGAYEVAYSERSTKWRMPSAHYRFRAKSVDFIALDTNLQVYGRDADQRRAVTAWLSEPRGGWRIAFGHHPYLSTGPHGDAGRYGRFPSFLATASGARVKSFFDEVVCGKVDLYLSGHDHSQQWMKPTCRGTELVVSGAGATLTSVGDRHPTHFQASQLGFFYAVADEKALTGQFIDLEGNIRFSRTLTR